MAKINMKPVAFLDHLIPLYFFFAAIAVSLF